MSHHQLSSNAGTTWSDLMKYFFPAVPLILGDSEALGGGYSGFRLLYKQLSLNQARLLS